MSTAKRAHVTVRRNAARRATENERPGDRPAGAPAGASIAAGAFFLAVGGTLLEVYSCIADLAGFDFTLYMLAEIGACVVLMAVVGLGLRAGKLWTVKLFRRATHTAALLYPAVIACSIWMASGTRPLDPAFVWIVVALAIVQIPAFIVIYRKFALVRWLDPRSLPSEWEPPPARAGARTNRVTPVWQLVVRAIAALAMLLRYYVGLIRSNWVGEWLASGSVLKEAVALMAIPGPLIVIGITLWLLVRARPRLSHPSE